MNRYRVAHTTRYEYETRVLHAHHLAYLRPRELACQTLVSWQMSVEPAPLATTRLLDYFGNDCDEIEILNAHDALAVTVESHVELSPRTTPTAETHPTTWNDFSELLKHDPAWIAVREFCFDSPLVRAHSRLRNFAAVTFPTGRPLVAAVREFCERLHEEFTYDATVTDVSTPLARVLLHKRGVCQDFAHLAVGCLRSLGLAARYVSGYLETLPPSGQPRLVGADASHAWASVYVPEYGWLDFDPTNGLFPRDRHIALAYGRDFSDVSPLSGIVIGGGAHRLTVSVDVEACPRGAPLFDSPE